MVAKYSPLNVQRSYLGRQQSPAQFDASSCSIETAIFFENATPRGPHLPTSSLNASPTTHELPYTMQDNSHHCDDDTVITRHVPASPKATLRQHQLFEVFAPISRTCDSREGSSVSYELSVDVDVVPQLATTDYRRGSVPSPERAATVILHAGGKELYMKKMRDIFSCFEENRCGT
jgi:hypothetical protein